MSIENATDYADILDSAETPIDLTTPELSDRMNTNEFNTFFQGVQSSLELLYQKTRYLQDMNEYIQNKILTTGKDCSDYITSIENNVNNAIDSYLNKSYVLKNVDLSAIQTESKLLKDRDDSDIPSCIYQDSKIIMPAVTVQKAYINNIAVSSSKECYSNNADFLLVKPYRSIYKIQSETDLTGVTEAIMITLDKEINCNYISMPVMNCTIKNIYAISEDSVQTEINIDSHYISPVRIKTLKVILYCDKYSSEAVNNSTQDSTDFLKSKSIKVGEATTVKEVHEELNNTNAETYAANVENIVNSYIATVNEVNSRNSNSNEVSNIMHTDELSTDDLNLGYVVSGDTTTNYIYTFGIDSLSIEDRKIYPAAAAILPIDISSCNKIEIEADSNIEPFSGIEIYKVDNNNTIPVNNVYNKNQINNEKIFYGKGTLFKIDSDKDIIIKKDGVVIDSVFTDVNVLSNLSEGDYTVSYNTTNAIANAKSVGAIKIIMRYDENINNIVPTITRLAVRQYGGDADWII